jgi:predicted dehydrogenase/nucleoside-diphosphate-sugar epimerase
MNAIGRLGHLGQLVAVADSSPDALKSVRETFPNVRTFESVDELLHRERLDVVHICTAPPTHEAVARRALEAGCHVYVEKPVVDTVGAIERLQKIASARGLIVMPGHQLLFEQPMRSLRTLVPALGRLVHAESYFSFRPARRDARGRVALRADLQLLDILPHPVYLLLAALEAAEPDGTPQLAGLTLGPRGTVHALVRQGAVTGTLTVTLDGRPVDSYLRVVGTNGVVHADFVRGTVQRQIGPGTSGIDKVLAPYRTARQLAWDTTAALAARARRRTRSYPGLAEIFEAMYVAVLNGDDAPVSPQSTRETVRICEAIASAIAATYASSAATTRSSATRTALVTGGTGFLGAHVVRSLLAQGWSVRVLARRLPAPWDRVAGAEYVIGELGGDGSAPLGDVDTIVHCAAETSGGWQDHEVNSIRATERLLRDAAAAGVERFIHVSSIAVLDESGRQPLTEDTPLERDPRSRGPYVWGKRESEAAVRTLARELGVSLRVVRPGALVDFSAFDPPGRLGKRIGGVFVAVGNPTERLGIIDVAEAGRVIAWMADHFEESPGTLHLLAPALPTRRELVQTLRTNNPGLMVVRLPRPMLVVLSAIASGAQRVLRPGRQPVNVARVFGTPRYDTTAIARVMSSMATVERDERVPVTV